MLNVNNEINYFVKFYFMERYIALRRTIKDKKSDIILIL